MRTDGGLARRALVVAALVGGGGGLAAAGTLGARGAVPGDAGGEPNRVLVAVTCFDAGDADPPPVASRTLERWLWNGATFVAEPAPPAAPK